MALYVEIIERKTRAVIHRIAAGASMRHAEHVEDGVCINLDHTHYITRIAGGEASSSR